MVKVLAGHTVRLGKADGYAAGQPTVGALLAHGDQPTRGVSSPHRLWLLFCIRIALYSPSLLGSGTSQKNMT